MRSRMNLKEMSQALWAMCATMRVCVHTHVTCEEPPTTNLQGFMVSQASSSVPFWLKAYRLKALSNILLS